MLSSNNSVLRQYSSLIHGEAETPIPHDRSHSQEIIITQDASLDYSDDRLLQRDPCDQIDELRQESSINVANVAAEKSEPASISDFTPAGQVRSSHTGQTRSFGGMFDVPRT